MTACVKNVPRSSMIAILQPVRYAGSRPSMVLPLSGGESNNGLRLRSNVFIACSLARSKSSARTSRSIDGEISLS